MLDARRIAASREWQMAALFRLLGMEVDVVVRPAGASDTGGVQSA